MVGKSCCVPACHAQTVVAGGFFPRVMRSTSIARFADPRVDVLLSVKILELIANNKQRNAPVDQDTAIVLTKERLQSMLEAAAKSVAAQAVDALTTRVGRTASLTGSASAGESTFSTMLPSYKRFPCVPAVH